MYIVKKKEIKKKKKKKKDDLSLDYTVMVEEWQVGS